MSREINDMMTEALDKAKELVTGERQKDYGTPDESFGRIAALWTDYLDVKITAEDAAIMMALLKIARLRGGRKTPDTYHDLIGYAAIAYGLRDESKNDRHPKTVEKQGCNFFAGMKWEPWREGEIPVPFTVLTMKGEESDITTHADISLLEALGLFIEAMSIQADIEAMKANDRRAEVIDCGSYTEKAYLQKAEELRKIAARLKGNSNG